MWHTRVGQRCTSRTRRAVRTFRVNQVFTLLHSHGHDRGTVSVSQETGRLCSPETDAGDCERLACTEVRQRPRRSCVLQCATWIDRAEWTRFQRLQDRSADQLTQEHHRHGTSLASGYTGCIRLAKDAVYWPLMNQDITDCVSKCSVCNMHRPEQCKEPMVPHDVPGRPWARHNRRLLRLVYENPPLPDSEPCEMRANPLPLEAGLMSRTTPRAETRMPMSELPPCEKPRPIQDTPPPPVDSTPMRRGTRTRKPSAYLADYQ